MKLLDRHGQAHEVDIGLVDKHGAFFLLLDSNEPCDYLRFSNEADALSRMYEQQQRLKKKLAEYEKPSFWQATNGLVSQAVAAQLLGVSQRTVQLMLDDGRLGFTMVGKARRVKLSEIERYQRFHEPC